MIVKKSNDIEKTRIIQEGVKDVWIRWLIGQGSGAPTFYLRLFEVDPGGHTPLHCHNWEHEVYILEGKGKIITPVESFPIEAGYFALISPEENHQFKNTGNQPLKFLCIIPKDGK